MNNFDIEKLLKTLRDKPEDYWIKRGKSMVLKLFYQMTKGVPAYKNFLKSYKVSSSNIKNIKNFSNIPTIDKNNYLRKYSLKNLCWNGKFKEQSWVIASTSGSAGEPFYFPRQDEQDLQYALLAELYLRTNFEIHKKSTLYIDAFPMGPWIGGIFTYQVIKIITQRGNYKLSIITTSVDKIEIIKAIKKFGKEFDQIIIGCYAPFLKDTIDDGIRHGVKWKDYNLKFIFSAEGFSETFRDYIIKKTGLKNPYKDTLNHYGTVDQGTLSYETPISILIRRLALKNKKLYKSIFGNIYKLPTLTQYMPEMFYFENVDGKLFCSSHSGLPLIRYDLKDNGGIIDFEQMKKLFFNQGVNLLREIKKAKIENTVWKLPFVYVYERNDFSVSFYAFQIYPETIKKALQTNILKDKITGKFLMMVRLNKKQDQYLEINVELKAKIKGSKALKQKINNFVVKRLLKENSEYRKTYSKIFKKAIPQIIFWPYEDKLYFKSGIKQKWIKK